MSEPRFTKEGVKIWVAPKIQGIGDGVKQHEITVVLLADHQSQIATLTQADHDKTAIIRSMELEAEGLRERVKRLEEGLREVLDLKVHIPEDYGLNAVFEIQALTWAKNKGTIERARAALSAERSKG